MTKQKTKPVDGDHEEVDAATLIALSFNARYSDTARDALHKALRDKQHAISSSLRRR